MFKALELSEGTEPRICGRYMEKKGLVAGIDALIYFAS